MQLIRYEAARQALAECKAVDEVKDIRDKAVAMQAYARQAKDTELMQNAAEIKVRAERALGEMIRQQKDTVGLAKPGPKSVDDVNRIPRLVDVGITKELSTRSQQLAAMPAEHFEAAIATARDTAQAVSTTHMLRLADEVQKTEALKAEIAQMKRDNSWKHARTALVECVGWFRVALENGLECHDEVAEEILRKMDELMNLKTQIERKITC